MHLTIDTLWFVTPSAWGLAAIAAVLGLLWGRYLTRRGVHEGPLWFIAPVGTLVAAVLLAGWPLMEGPHVPCDNPTLSYASHSVSAHLTLALMVSPVLLTLLQGALRTRGGTRTLAALGAALAACAQLWLWADATRASALIQPMDMAQVTSLTWTQPLRDGLPRLMLFISLAATWILLSETRSLEAGRRRRWDIGLGLLMLALVLSSVTMGRAVVTFFDHPVHSPSMLSLMQEAALPRSETCTPSP